MPISKREKNDVLRNVRIEMDRMFGVLSSYYERPDLDELLPLLAEIEIRFKINLQKMSEPGSFLPMVFIK